MVRWMRWPVDVGFKISSWCMSTSIASGVSRVRSPAQMHQRGDCWQRGQRMVPLRTTLRAMMRDGSGLEAGAKSKRGVALFDVGCGGWFSSRGRVFAHPPEVTERS